MCCINIYVYIVMKFVDIKVMNCVDTGIEYISNELYWYKSYEQY